MKIKSMTATFGRLEGARLELGPGLNVLCAPNEGGKSTWAAFWRAMLYGIDTRDRDRKGYLADKNRYQPWSGHPMMGEVDLQWQGRDITIRRGPRGSVPFGSFSAVYTGTQEPVPGLAADNCGQLLTGAGPEVFSRSAFIGGGGMALTTAPELERRIAAIVSSGQEDVSFSQVQDRLKDWKNKRQVNRSVGDIPRLEGELAQVEDALGRLEDVSGRIAQLEGRQAALKEELAALEGELAVHRALERQKLAQRYDLARQEHDAARAQLAALEQEQAKYGPIPAAQLLKKAQGELQYLKVLDEEIQAGQSALEQAEEAYIQAQIAVQEDRFPGMTPEQAAQDTARQLQAVARSRQKAGRSAALGAVLLAVMAGLLIFYQLAFSGGYPTWVKALPPVGVALFLGGIYCLYRGKRAAQNDQVVFACYQVPDRAGLDALLQDYSRRCQAAHQAAQQVQTVKATLNDRMARRDNSWGDVLALVHTFAPEVQNEFGVSAALSRALSLEHELDAARDRVEQRRRRLDDLQAQGAGQDHAAAPPLAPPDRAPQQTADALALCRDRLEQVRQQLDQALGQQQAMGDPAALAAQKEALENALARRRLEFDALSLSMEVMAQANGQLQQRFSPELNALAGGYLARLTGERYTALTLTRELEGSVRGPGDVLPRSALYLSRGTADQLYLAVRLAVCALCLPQRPPLVLDDALAAFDQQRLERALDLLRELAQEQQILLFSCHQREREALAGVPGVTHPAL